MRPSFRQMSTLKTETCGNLPDPFISFIRIGFTFYCPAILQHGIRSLQWVTHGTLLTDKDNSLLIIYLWILICNEKNIKNHGWFFYSKILYICLDVLIIIFFIYLFIFTRENFLSSYHTLFWSFTLAGRKRI